ncbi:uncharacterized protein OCT59_013053 [Rhizophagus irregularis]|nr:hypothetical protein OCT59_013053 [Rhizophagus irregularis]GBC31718.1 kinase-like domain-containing protein [Rhizophagus irregularis DAOM 181602=DAOM 197198]
MELASSIDIPFAQFIRLIRIVSEIFLNVTDLYNRSSQHNKNITKILMERISIANVSVNILQARKDLLNTTYYKSLQRLVQVLQDMKKFIENITQYNIMQRYLEKKVVENEFKELCEKYDNSINVLNFHLLVNFKFNAQEEDDIIIGAVELATSVSNIFSNYTELYKSSQHYDYITKILKHIFVANISVNILQAKKDLLTSNYYKSLQGLDQVLHNMIKYIEEIKQKNLKNKMIKKKFPELCEEYDSSISLLNFNLLVDLMFSDQEENYDTIFDAVELATSVSDIFSKSTESNGSTQHNKNIAKILTERVSAVITSVNILQAREESLTSTYYKGLQRLIQVLHSMKKFIGEIVQHSKMQMYLVGNKKIKKEFKDLCEEYDSSINLLNFNLLVDFMSNSQENKIVKKDIAQLIKFLVLAKNTNLVNEQVNEIAVVMQMVQNNKKGNINQIQNKIDNLPSFPYEDYEEAYEEICSDKLRKYVHVKTEEEFAFKVLDQDHINDVKNLVALFMKHKVCQNIIKFYGLTSNGVKTYLITEWAENGNLRNYILNRGQNIELKLKIRIAYDIAKGLNFLDSVKVIHRDIRSENIVITHHDIAKITNFKFSRIFDEATCNIAINKECVRYSAPEMLRREMTEEQYYTKYNSKCEVYSFGILLWEIAECKIPYEKFEDILEITRKVVDGYREKFTSSNVIPEKYQNLVNKSVDPNPDSRPIFSMMLTDLQDIYKSYSNSLNNNRSSPVQKTTQSTIVAEEDYEINRDLGLYYENRAGTEKDDEKNEVKTFELILKNAGCDKVNFMSYKELENIVPLVKGGFGEIMKAFWTKKKSHVICKKLIRTTDLKHNLLDAFIHELKIHLRLDYYNDRIIRCLGISFDKNANEYLLILQYANDGDLQNYLQKKFGKLTWDDKKKLAFQIADGLNYLHNEDVLHRDLHSKNIVIHDGNAKITDFGISKIQNSQKSTAYIGNFGIIAYMEPKRILDRNFPYTKSSDIYSFGVLMWEISSGCPPFKSSDNIITLGLAINSGTRETTISGTPEEYKELYKKCWKQEPEQRPAISEVLGGLERMVKSSDNNTIPTSKMEANRDDDYLRIDS